MDLDRTACSVKWKVFINKGAGNLPKSSPNRLLLYLIKCEQNKNERNFFIASTRKLNEAYALNYGLSKQGTYTVKNRLKVYHTRMKNNVFNTLATEKGSLKCGSIAS